jgi:hypothetical protein
MSKSRKEMLLELLELESDNLGDVGKTSQMDRDIIDCINEVPDEKVETKNDCITKPKKKLTEKQLEALKKGQQTRDENARKRKEEAMRIAEEEKKKLEAKIVRKAISIKKKEIKKQSALDEISDDETPIQKIKEVVKQGTNEKERCFASPTTPPLPLEKPKPANASPLVKINFF